MSIKILAAALLLTLPVGGAEGVLPELRVVPTAGGSIFFVKNVQAQLSQPLTAFLIELVDYPGSFYQLFEDDITTGSLAPGQEKRIPVTNMTVGAVPDYVKLQAAIYADGTTAGVPDRVEKLVARRRFRLDTVQDLIRRIGTSKEDAAGSLKRAAEGMTMPKDKGSQVAINYAAGRALIADITDFLGKHSVEETLAQLQKWEKNLRDSKPGL